MAGLNGFPKSGRDMVASLKLPTLGIPASSGAGGCQTVATADSGTGMGTAIVDATLLTFRDERLGAVEDGAPASAWPAGRARPRRDDRRLMERSDEGRP